MRKRFNHCRVCSCSPEKGVMFLDAKMLVGIVNHGVRAIRSASTCPRKAHRGILLGDLCVEAHHPMWALKVWKFTLDQIHWKDYDDWIDVCFHTEYVRLQDVISEGICEIIGRRIDEVERSVGLSNPQGRDSWEYKAGEGWYNYLRYEKYDYSWEELWEDFVEMLSEASAQQETERIFLEGQNEYAPMPQDFFDYWNEPDSSVQEDLLSFASSLKKT